MQSKPFIRWIVSVVLLAGPCLDTATFTVTSRSNDSFNSGTLAHSLTHLDAGSATSTTNTITINPGLSIRLDGASGGF